jgi:hypothetical protein
VSFVLRGLEQRGGVVGRIAAGLAGIAWSLVTFLVLPVLVIEDVGVMQAIRRSGALFRRTWGENLAAQVGFGLLGFVLSLPAILVLFAAGAAGSTVAGIGFVLAVLWIVIVTLVLATLNGIFQTALYLYAADGSVPGGWFDEGDLARVFQPRAR